MMNTSESVRRAFVKEMSLPIQIVESPYFEYYLDVLNPYFNSKDSYSILLDFLKQASIDHNSNDLEFLQNSLTKKVIYGIEDAIKQTQAYADFNAMDMSQYQISEKRSYDTESLYSVVNVGKKYISIDLKKANFQALKFINPEIVLNANSYDELVERYSPYLYHKKSKQMRQVIFGNLNPKRQATIQSFIMKTLSNELEKLGLKFDKMKVCSADEIVFPVDAFEGDIFEVMAKREFLKDIEFHVEEFEIQTVDKNHFACYKKYTSGKIEFKGVNKNYIYEVIKRFEDKELTENDLLFYSDGRICRFLNPIFPQKNKKIFNSFV